MHVAEREDKNGIGVNAPDSAIRRIARELGTDYSRGGMLGDMAALLHPGDIPALEKMTLEKARRINKYEVEQKEKRAKLRKLKVKLRLIKEDVALLEDSRDITTGAAARMKALDDMTVAAEKKAQQLEIFTDVLGHMLNTVQKSCVQFTCQIGGIRKALQACDHEFDQVKEMTKTLQRTETAAKEQIFKCRRLVEKNYAHFESTLKGRQKQVERVQRVRQWKDMRKKAEQSRSKMENRRARKYFLLRDTYESGAALFCTAQLYGLDARCSFVSLGCSAIPIPCVAGHARGERPRARAQGQDGQDGQAGELERGVPNAAGPSKPSHTHTLRGWNTSV